MFYKLIIINQKKCLLMSTGVFINLLKFLSFFSPLSAQANKKIRTTCNNSAGVCAREGGRRHAFQRQLKVSSKSTSMACKEQILWYQPVFMRSTEKVPHIPLGYVIRVAKCNLPIFSERLKMLFKGWFRS